MDERCLGLIGNRLCKKSLSGAGRTKQQHALGWFDSNALERLRFGEWKFHSLPKRFYLLIQPTDPVVRYIRRLNDFHSTDCRIA